MGKSTSRRPGLTPTLFATVVLPFAIPILLTFALVLLVGNAWPRSIALGSGLKLAGLAATAITGLAVWYAAAARARDPAVARFAALACGVTALMGWPVWSVGVLPSINGSVLDGPLTVRMTLERTAVTNKRKSREFYHWAWLRAERGESVIGSGRYFIAEDVYDRWRAAAPAAVDVRIARGLLGAQVVLGFAP
jgi:hypothetical protein